MKIIEIETACAFKTTSISQDAISMKSRQSTFYQEVLGRRILFVSFNYTMKVANQ